MTGATAGFPELALLRDCCRWTFAAQPGERLVIPAGLDWAQFVSLARFHGVQALAGHALRSIEPGLPAATAEALAADARKISATNLQKAAEARDLRVAFERAGLHILFVKGLTVGALAYAKPLLKTAWDIDILVDEGKVTEAAALLTARGYERTIPAATINLRRWHVRHKESVWARPEQQLYVELHTRLADNRRLIPAIGMTSPTREIDVVSGITLPTLAADELFAYLCVHGASSLWFRLKWITDVAALLSSCRPAEIERLYQRSQELGAGRAADQALLLADALYGSLSETGLAAALAGKRGSRWLASAAFRQVAANTDGREPTATVLGTRAIHWTQLLLLPDPGFAVGEAYRQLRDAIA